MPADLDRCRLDVASALLAKAGSTKSSEEAVALAQKCYRLLAEHINDYEDMVDAAVPGPRKRERRLLQDRRRSFPAPGSSSPSTQRPSGVDWYRSSAAAELDVARKAIFDVRI